jgi:transketolase
MKRPMPAPTERPRLTTSAMIASIAETGQPTRAAPFGHALVEAARSRPELLGMTADLGKYTDLHIFGKAHPDRYYQMGMAEQLLFGAASGLAAEGFTPFATTYAVFATRRAYDFIHQTIAEEDRNVKIVCALPGLTSGYGPSHQATDDLALMRAMPNMTIIDPCDALETEQAVPAIADHRGPVYMRLLRGQVPLVLDKYDYRFEIGKAKLLRDGADVLFISTGLMTMRTLDAAEKLAADKIGAAVLHVSTIKPLDTEAIVREAGRSGRLVVVAENHSIIGGLGEAVARTLMLHGVTARFRHIGLPDQFLDAGALPTLHDRYGISTREVVRQVKDGLT